MTYRKLPRIPAIASAFNISCAILCLLFCSSALAQVPNVPASVDVSRIKPEERPTPIDQGSESQIVVPDEISSTPIPEGSKEIHFVLKDVKIEGNKAFSQNALKDIYQPYLNKEITLDLIYTMAGRITERYKNAGYFLSRAYVPPQEIEGGIITIKVVEGYIGKVEIDDDMKNSVVRKYIDKLLLKKPLKADALESFLLRVNDLPGYVVTGVLSAINNGEDGEVKLTMKKKKKDSVVQLGFDNISSRFLGPNELNASYTNSFLPLQQTTVSTLTGLPSEKLNYFTLNHTATLAPDISVDLTGNYTKAKPGFRLEKFDIVSDSTYLSAGINYQWIRQRRENLALKFSFDTRNSNSDILEVPFTRDRVRAFRANINYDNVDSWSGYNVLNLTLSQGIDTLGSSKKGGANLSRSQADPNFTKAVTTLSRTQSLTTDWSILGSASGQYASGPLFSAEEFGYGGQAFGRAYDSSEIVGDHGVSGALELRYNGWVKLPPVAVAPYAFYDFGMVWNEDIGQYKKASGTSAGFGLKFVVFNINGNVGLAWPLTRKVSTPIYGQEDTDARIILQLSEQF